MTDEKELKETREPANIKEAIEKVRSLQGVPWLPLGVDTAIDMVCDAAWKYDDLCE